jgi:glycosyltransferase involved in cell wall biosynthesis
LKAIIRYSLLVPCFNAEKFIDSFLKNISKLNKQFDEIIFYDDASTDGTVNLLKSKNCNIIENDINRGPGYARNQLANAATGDYIHFHDVDDELDADYLSATSTIAFNHAFDVILCNVNWYNAHTKTLQIEWKYSDAELQKNPIGYTIANPIGGINGLYKRSKFIETCGFNTTIRIWEDADMHVKLAAAKSSFYVIEKVLSYSLRYSESASKNQSFGWLIRLSLLQNYYTLFTDDTNRVIIGKQAQIAAGNLILSKQTEPAKIALQLSELCDVKVPDNNSKIWKLIKIIFPEALRINLRLLQLRLAFNNSK